MNRLIKTIKINSRRIEEQIPALQLAKNTLCLTSHVMNDDDYKLESVRYHHFHTSPWRQTVELKKKQDSANKLSYWSKHIIKELNFGLYSLKDNSLAISLVFHS